MFDLTLVNGTILDGTGRAALRADIGVTGECVTAIGDLGRAETKKTLEARGHYICPGFIDTHSHSDAYLLIEPSAPSKIFQGVTTEVVGNCGASAAPRSGSARMPSDWEPFTYPGRWNTMAEYRRLFEQVKSAVNVVALVGHNTVRASVIGYEGRAATTEELSAMERML
ncbi:MAG: amidohydrolase family protein, partial [bacterium]